MPRIVAIELVELDLPFRQPFQHAAAERVLSSSLFARFITDTGHIGYGETLPRPYVTGEERGEAFDLLAERILPRLLDLELPSIEALIDFLTRCDGKAPPDWVAPAQAQTAAWCAVDLGLLDAFGRAFGSDLRRELARVNPWTQSTDGWPEGLRYSGVLSGGSDRRALRTLLKARLYGLQEAKVKVEVEGLSTSGVRLARRILGRDSRLRVDTNMGWSREEAREAMPRLARYGVESFEQPLAADDLEGMARLVSETGLQVMADESFHDADSLERLIEIGACTAVNVRIAKCGGVVASLARCRRAIDAGLGLQIGCQVGETSHLSAAQLLLVLLVGERVHYLEGCYGERLLETDPVRPLLQFRRGGRPPTPPPGPGLGTTVEMSTIREFAGRRVTLGSARRPTVGEPP